MVHLLDSEGEPVWELHYDVGTTVEMMCRVKKPPIQGPFHVEWEAQKTKTTDQVVHQLHRDVTRGGVKVETGIDERSGYLISRISLASARKSDAGNYTCRLGGVPPDISRSYPRLQDTIVLHVLEGEMTKAIHSNGAVKKQLTNVNKMSLLSLLWVMLSLYCSVVNC